MDSGNIRSAASALSKTVSTKSLWSWWSWIWWHLHSVLYICTSDISVVRILWLLWICGAWPRARPPSIPGHHKYICLWPGTWVRIQMFGYSHTAERTFTTKTFMTRPVKCLNKLYIGFNLAASIKYELIPIDATKLLFARSQMVRLILAVGRYVGQHWYYYQGLYFITTYTVQLLSFLFNLLVVLVCRIYSIGRW